MKTTRPFKSRVARVYPRNDDAFLVKIRQGSGYKTRVFHNLSEANTCARKATREAEILGSEYAIPLSAMERAIISAFRASVSEGNDAESAANAAIEAIRRRSLVNTPVSALTGAFISASRADSERARRIKQRIRAFTKALPNDSVSEINNQSVSRAIAVTTKGLSQATGKDWISTIRAFVTFACEQTGMSKPTIRVPARAKPRNRIETLSNEQVRELLSRAASITPEFLPAIALQLFCGLRASEALRLRCEDIRGSEVFLSREITKTAQARRVPVPENAQALVSTLASGNPKDFVVAPKTTGEERRSQAYAVALRTIEKLPRNVLRKTAISNYCALVGNAKAADICGNSIATQGEYYRDLKSADDAREFFATSIPSPKTSLESL